MLRTTLGLAFVLASTALACGEEGAPATPVVTSVTAQASAGTELHLRGLALTVTIKGGPVFCVAASMRSEILLLNTLIDQTNCGGAFSDQSSLASQLEQLREDLQSEGPLIDEFLDTGDAGTAVRPPVEITLRGASQALLDLIGANPQDVAARRSISIRIVTRGGDEASRVTFNHAFLKSTTSTGDILSVVFQTSTTAQACANCGL